MGSHYDRINELSVSTGALTVSANSLGRNSSHSHNVDLRVPTAGKTTMLKRVLSFLSINKDTLPIESELEAIERHSHRSESTTSIYSDTFQLKKRLWIKNRLLLIITGLIIVLIIVFIAVLIVEPWKRT
jgi:hypothetical protein